MLNAERHVLISQSNVPPSIFEEIRKLSCVYDSPLAVKCCSAILNPWERKAILKNCHNGAEVKSAKWFYPQCSASSPTLFAIFLVLHLLFSFNSKRFSSDEVLSLSQERASGPHHRASCWRLSFPLQPSASTGYPFQLGICVRQLLEYQRVPRGMRLELEFRIDGFRSSWLLQFNGCDLRRFPKA